MATIIDGRQISKEIRAELTARVEEMKGRGILPGLAVVLVGEDPASQSYVKSKERASREIGIYSEFHRIPAETTQAELLGMVRQFNEDPKIHGILVQLPLPEQIDEQAIIHAIRPEKDVDGFHPVSVGNLLIGERCFVPCTARGIIELLERTGVELKGKEAVVVGRSNIVGKPVSMLLMQNHCTVTMCHTRTRDLAYHTRRAEILVAAAGRPHVISGDMIAEGAVVIDVGVNRVDGKLCGDVDYDSAVDRAAAITPVPGGVGPMTVTMLMENTLQAAEDLSR